MIRGNGWLPIRIDDFVQKGGEDIDATLILIIFLVLLAAGFFA